MAPLVAFLVSFGLLVIMLKWPALLPMDRPNSRSLHDKVTPRAGGLALVPAIVAGWYPSVADIAPLMICVVTLAAVSGWDDARGLPVVIRLLFHGLVAAFFIAWLSGEVGTIQNGEGIVVVAIFTLIVWFINLFNFMDGSDGLAGGMAVIGFATFAVAAWQSGNGHMFVLNACIACAALGFLCHNYPPARVFLGDSGSVPLGFLAVAMGLLGTVHALWPWWFPALVFSPFLVDTTVTLLARVVRLERVWQAHRDHYFQRLIRSGWSHRKLVMNEYLLMVTCALAALWGRTQELMVQYLLLSAALLFYLVLAVLVNSRWRQWNNAQNDQT